MTSYQILMSHEAVNRIREYCKCLQSGSLRLGQRTGQLMPFNQHFDENSLVVTILQVMLASKEPQIFAESAVKGDGTDWNRSELSILGDVSIGMPVTIFDNGFHSSPTVHSQDGFRGYLVYTCGALLAPDYSSADWEELISSDAGLYIDPEKYYRLYERRLLPCFQYANDTARNSGRRAFITIPGLGCGQFAGRFKGQIGQMLDVVLQRILTGYGSQWEYIGAVYYDPCDEGDAKRGRIHNIEYIVMPLAKSSGKGKPQLCKPKDYEGMGGKSDNFDDCDLFSFVAWDHVSWPGNDFWIGQRSTDDGVKAAATDSMFRMTGIQGNYDTQSNKYLPPSAYVTWKDALLRNQIRLDTTSLTGSVMGPPILNNVPGLSFALESISTETKVAPEGSYAAYLEHAETFERGSDPRQLEYEGVRLMGDEYKLDSGSYNVGTVIALLDCSGSTRNLGGGGRGGRFGRGRRGCVPDVDVDDTGPSGLGGSGPIEIVAGAPVPSLTIVKGLQGEEILNIPVASIGPEGMSVLDVKQEIAKLSSVTHHAVRLLRNGVILKDIQVIKPEHVTENVNWLYVYEKRSETKHISLAQVDAMGALFRSLAKTIAGPARLHLYGFSSSFQEPLDGMPTRDMAGPEDWQNLAENLTTVLPIPDFGGTSLSPVLTQIKGHDNWQSAIVGNTLLAIFTDGQISDNEQTAVLLREMQATAVETNHQVDVLTVGAGSIGEGVKFEALAPDIAVQAYRGRGFRQPMGGMECNMVYLQDLTNFKSAFGKGRYCGSFTDYSELQETLRSFFTGDESYDDGSYRLFIEGDGVDVYFIPRSHQNFAMIEFLQSGPSGNESWKPPQLCKAGFDMSMRRLDGNGNGLVEAMDVYGRKRLYVYVPKSQVLCDHISGQPHHVVTLRAKEGSTQFAELLASAKRIRDLRQN